MALVSDDLDTVVKASPKEFIFERLVHRMDSLGYDPDTTFFDEKMYQEGVFHYANYETHFIHELLTNESNYGDLISVKYDKLYDERFSRVQDIVLYPWRMPDTPEGRMRNGVVEQWTFENSSDAAIVLEFLKSELDYQGFPFIKTQAYYFQCGKKLYLLYSPDSGVAYRHQQFYDWLISACQ